MTTLAIQRTSPIGEIARHHPATIALFETLDLDYACRGGRPLEHAALTAGLDPEELVRSVASIANDSPRAEEGTLAELLHTIITEHHRLDLDTVRDLTTRLARMDHEPLAGRIRRLLLSVHEALRGHILREERELFPRIEELDLHPHRVRAGSISRPLLAEFVEHEAVSEYLGKLRELTTRLRGGDADAGLLDEIEHFVLRVRRHLHQENNVLIPRVLELESRLKSARLSGTAHMH